MGTAKKHPDAIRKDELEAFDSSLSDRMRGKRIDTRGDEEQRIFEEIMKIQTELYGRRSDPLHAKELEDRLMELHKRYNNPEDSFILLKGFPSLLRRFNSEIKGDGKEQQPTEEEKKEEVQPEERFVFRKLRGGWYMVFKGKKLAYLEPDLGFSYMHYCMEPEREGKDISSFDLEEEFKSAAVTAMREAERQFSNELKAEKGEDEQKSFNKKKKITANHLAILDKQAMEKYRERTEELKEDIERLEGLDDPASNLLRVAAEKELGQLKANVFKGKSKEFADEVKRWNNRVSAAIGRAIEKLEDDQEAYEHFKRAFRPINSPSHHYRPTQKIIWNLS